MNHHFSEGYIKFQIIHDPQIIDIDKNILVSFNENRNKLQKLHLIGMYNDGIGYGNISIRKENSNQFYITGSATGNLSMLLRKHIALVTDFNISKNLLKSSGITKASSESLSHAAIYSSLDSVNSVVHIHNLYLWEKYYGILPTTDKNIEYGTPEMAISIQNEILKIGNKKSLVIIMGGHPEGIIAYGQTIFEATDAILKLYQLKSNGQN